MPTRGVDDPVHGVHTAFSQQARRAPTAIAAECGDQSLSYGELDRRSDALASSLRRAGVSAEDRVAVCVEPSLGLLVAELAVLKVGAAYVPIDPDYPNERIRYLLADSAATAVISESGYAEHLAGGPTLILLDGELHIGDARFMAEGAEEVHPHNAACVIYTSGSTGNPKGVVITHGGLTHLARCAAARFALHPGDRFLQTASISFSAFLEEVFPSLLTGATVVLAGYQRALTSTRTLLEVLLRRRITGFGITTALWHGLVEDMTADGDRFPESLRFVLMGGEAARPDRVRQWMTLGVALVHVYGPTEVTATATYLHTDEHSPDSDTNWTLPIGSPIPDTPVYLLDADMRPIAADLPGEAYVGGVQVARGYLGRPALTADSFLPDPYGEAGTRMYRTGDTVRRAAHGNLEFIGRRDDQLKVSGYRIEPAEVEAVIEQHPDIKQACVVAAPDGSGGHRLSAYVVLRSGEPHGLDVESARSHLAARLPAFMVPGAWIPLDSLPLTPNGKVDRPALARLPIVVTAPCDLAAAGDPVETAVAGIWAAVLGVEEIGVTDDFFALGGDSLKVARVIARTRRTLGVELPPKAVFDHRTVRELAEVLRTLTPADSTVGDRPAGDQAAARRRRELVTRVLRQRAGVPDASPLSAGQRGLWYVNELLDDSPAYNTPWWCRFSGSLDIQAFTSALASVARRHAVLRSRFRTVDGVPIQVVEPDGAVDFEVLDLRGTAAAGREAAAFAAAHTEAARRIDVRSEMVRVRLARIDDDDHLLVVNVHHLAFDGASADIFLEDLGAFYSSALTGTPTGLPELPGSYADFAAWQAEHLSGARLDRLMEHWQDRLSGATRLILPQDRTGSADVDRPAGKITSVLPPDVRDRIGRLAPDTSTTRFMVLFTIFLMVLHRRCGQDDMCIGTPVAHRPLPSHERLLGYFINTLILRCDLSGDPSFRELVGRVRDVCLDAYHHQDLPLDVLVERLGRADAPQVTATFSVDRAPGRNARFAALELTPGHEIPTGRARFDLVWLVEEIGPNLQIAVDFDSDRFDPETVRALIDDFTALITAVAADPDRPLSRLSETTATELTAELCRIFARAFELDEVAPDQDFFELGGYSALAATLAARIRERFAVELSLREFFDEPTVAGIAGKIREAAPARPTPRAADDDVALEDLLREIGNLSDEEIGAMFDGDQ